MTTEREESKKNKKGDSFLQMKMRIRKEMKGLFKTPDNAFAEMDFNGNGFIEEDDFFQTLLNYKLPYSKEEIKKFFAHEKLFIRSPDGKMNFELFKKSFFPQ
jgi:Ca2+-binding EF-hand superfamily protein